MSWSFYIKNGDLSLSGPKGFAVVTGVQKLLQDVKHWILEPQGTDPIHPSYGSIFDGGISSDGSPIEGYIGSNVIKERLLDVESEMRRILYAYQDQQLSRLKRDQSYLNGKNTFGPNEILYSVDGVDTQLVDNDKIVMQLKLKTQNGSSVTFVQPIE